LLEALETAWRNVAGGTTEQFLNWLEQVEIESDDDEGLAEQYVDSLDSFLIAAIQEVEELRDGEVAPTDIEQTLLRIWRHTYAFASAVNEEALRSIWLRRGSAIKTHYPNAAQRREIYRTSLPPASARALIVGVQAIRQKLIEGNDYATHSTEARFTFITEVLALLSNIRPFAIGTNLGRRRNFRDWRRILRWWLAKGTLAAQPEPGQITIWYDFVATNFIYRGVWGVGSALGLLLDLAPDGQPVRAMQIDDWPRSGLPWIAFWLKELMGNTGAGRSVFVGARSGHRPAAGRGIGCGLLWLFASRSVVERSYRSPRHTRVD
jgi:hypothetical protein